MSKPAAQRRQQKIDAQRAHKRMRDHERRLKKRDLEVARNEKILRGPLPKALQPWDGDFVAIMHPQCAADLKAAAQPLSKFKKFL